MCVLHAALPAFVAARADSDGVHAGGAACESATLNSGVDGLPHGSELLERVLHVGFDEFVRVVDDLDLFRFEGIRGRCLFQHLLDDGVAAVEQGQAALRGVAAPVLEHPQGIVVGAVLLQGHQVDVDAAPITLDGDVRAIGELCHQSLRGVCEKNELCV